MLNKIWPIFILISIIYAFLSGNIENLNNTIFDSLKEAVNLTIIFLGTICMWNGIMKIIKNTSLINKINIIFKPVINYLFPDLKDNKKAKEEISMNIIANVLGLGNAATPLGLNAMKTMQKDNIKKDTLNNSMIMFILLNTASMQIIPTTVIAIRTSLGSENPSKMVVAIWISSFCALIAGIFFTKLFIKYSKK